MIGAIAVLLLWNDLLKQDWPIVTLLVLTILLIFDDWYGGYRRYSKLPYELGHFLLDIIAMFVFLLMMFAISYRSTLFASTMWLYAFHGLVWDAYFAHKIQGANTERKDLETSLRYASLLALTFSGLQFFFGINGILSLGWNSVLTVVLAWSGCRIILFVLQQQPIRSSNVVASKLVYVT
jgi:hypothetical protein